MMQPVANLNYEV